MKSIFGIMTIIKEISKTFDKKQRRQAIILLVLMFIGSLLELLGVGIIVPFVQSVLNPEKLMDNVIIAQIWGLFEIDDYRYLVLFLGIGIIIIYILKNAYLIYVSAVKFTYAMQWQKDISVNMLKSYMKRPYSYFMNINSADILRGCSEDILAFYEVLNNLFTFIMELTTAIAICVYLIITDAFTALCTIVLIIITFFGLSVLLKPTVKRLGIIAKKAISLRNKSITQTVQGIKDIIVMQRKELFVEEYSKAAELARSTNRKYNIIRALPDRVTEGVCVSGIIGIVCIRILIGDDSMTEFIPKLAAFAMASFKVLPSVGKITNALNSMIFSRPMQHNVYMNISEARLYENSDRALDGDKDIEKNIENYLNNSFVVSMKDVVWKYEGQQKNVLDGLNLCINKGESVGFIGASGAGKTTTSDILLGLLKPISGSVSINDRDIFQMPYTWAKVVAYVPQSVFLLDDTVRANVAFGVTQIKDEDIWSALEQAQLKNFVESLPEGLDTIVGERGIKFSGGQRQRIAIARALYNKPLLLVMDEATASLDNETENAVMEAIENLQGKITMVIVAHRLTTIRKCDRIYEIGNGVATLVENSAF